MKNKTSFITLSCVFSMFIMITACGGLAENGSPASSLATFSVSPATTTMNSDTTVMLTPSGGLPPYYYSIVSNVGGAIDTPQGPSASFTAGYTSGTAKIRVNDSAGEIIYVVISVTPINCEGTFSVTIAGTTGTMQIVEDDSNVISGFIDLNGTYSPLSGTCASGTINFTDPSSGAIYSGTYSLTAPATRVSMSGTVTVGGTTNSWSGN